MFTAQNEPINTLLDTALVLGSEPAGYSVRPSPV